MEMGPGFSNHFPRIEFRGLVGERVSGLRWRLDFPAL